MNNLNKRSFGGLLFLLFVMGALLFFSAWTFNYWQAWVFLVMFGISTLLVTLYLMKNDRKLLEKRVDAGPGAEKEKNQKIIQSVSSIAFIVIFVLSAIDYRLAWSRVPSYISVAGDILVALGLLMVFFVFKKNSFTSAAIEVDIDQKVISTGLYALVRHPMYTGAIVMLIGIPPALGSWWGLLAVIWLILVIIWRLLDEERFLAKNLKGYVEYQNKVKYRLIPFIW